jgi:hypothetical protein
MNKLTFLTCAAWWPRGLRHGGLLPPAPLPPCFGPPSRATRFLPAPSRSHGPAQEAAAAARPLPCFADGWGPLSAVSSTYEP